jgi:hypothetical protein
LLHEVEIHDVGAVVADESLGIEAALEVVQHQVHEIRPRLRVHLDVVVRRLEPLDLSGGNGDDPIAVANEQASQRTGFRQHETLERLDEKHVRRVQRTRVGAVDDTANRACCRGGR